MRKLNVLQQVVWLMFGALFLVGCRTAADDPTPSTIPLVQLEPVLVDEVSVTLIRARLRNSFQSNYIVSVPPAEHVYLELTLDIEGPAEPLVWAQDMLHMDYQGTEPDLGMTPRPIRTDDGSRVVYLFTYVVPESADFDEFSLLFADGQRVELDPFALAVPESTVGRPQGLGTVGGGTGNAADGRDSTVSGGSYNSAQAFKSTIAGGSQNEALAQETAIGGGVNNVASGPRASVGGGWNNTASQLDTTVAGGANGVASGTHATVGGGSHNIASGRDATVSGGYYNTAEGTNASISGGTENQAAGFGSTVGGGAGNHAVENHSTVAGGLGNDAAGIYSTVAGGQSNSAGGAYATVPGGLLNQAAGDYSVAAGQQAQVQVEHAGVFLFADATDVAFESAAANEFAVRASGGVRLVTAVDQDGRPLAGVELPAGSGSWSTLSDEHAKENLVPVDGQQLLEQVVQLPITTWNYTSQDASIRHLGPMAQDFFTAFGVGQDAEHISAVDADGVALAAIQGLYQRLQAQDQLLLAQQEQIEDLENRLGALEGKNQGQTENSSTASLWPLAGLLLVSVVLRPRRD